jgi:hypothetical protein
VAQKTLILVERVLLAVQPALVFELRLAQPAPVFIAGVLRAPEPSGLALRFITNKAGLAFDFVGVRGCHGGAVELRAAIGIGLTAA